LRDLNEARAHDLVGPQARDLATEKADRACARRH